MASRQIQFILSFDFDGTLVSPGSDPVFHPMLGQMIQQLRKLGAAWVINTGRSLSQTLEGLAQYGLFMEPDYIIAREGDLYKPGTFKRWTDFGSWNKEARKAQTRFLKDHREPLHTIRQVVQQQTQASFLEGADQDIGIVATEDAEMDRICAYIDQFSPAFPNLAYHRNSIYLRFAHKKYSKGSALAELTRLLNLDASRCFAAGDNFNDIPMLDTRVARMIATPGNALPAIKEHVRQHGGFVAEKVASEGMIQALQHFFHSGQKQV
jgi:HAD superfamily hydrolase (TIGR01484 family)